MGKDGGDPSLGEYIMKTIDLVEYGVDRELVDLWISEGIEDLLPIQTAAIIRHHLFDIENLLVFSPTSSGKTFIGEMAAVNVTRKNQRALYLVPQKALAEEKFEEFRRRYKSQNIKVVVSTRDRKEYDRRINSGDYDIAVVVYEKMQSLLVSSPALLKIVGAVVIDELQMIGDPHRGADLEVLLTKILTYPDAPKIIGLSAVLGKANALAKWMGAQLCLSKKRPMELRKGVQFDECFRYMEHNSKDKGTEPLGALVDYSDKETATALSAALFACEGEQCLIFRKSRKESVAMAKRVGNDMESPPASAAIKELEGLEDSENKDMLRALLSKGVAYHNSDLDWEQRDLIERHFKKGDIKVLCSTSTLAMGMNLPVKNVFVDPEKWDVDHTGHWMRVPISQGEYENMGGRAGRLGLGCDFGRAILMADGKHQARTYWSYYVNGKPVDIEPTLDGCPIEHHVLNFVASGLCKTRIEIRDILLSSFTGKLCWSGDEKTTAFEEKLNNGIAKCIEGELIEEDDDGKISVTELGRAVAIKGVTVDTALCLAKKVRNYAEDAESINLFDMLFWINACPEGLNIHFGFSTEEYHSNQYIHLLREMIRTLPGPVYERYKKIEKINHLAYDKAKMLKKTLLLYEWVCGVDTQVLEKRFQCYTGSIGNLGREFAWLAETLGAIAKVLDWPDEKVKEIFDLSARLIHGVPLEATKISTIKVRGLGRGRMKALAVAGLDTFDKILDASLQQIEKLVTKPVASRLVKRIRRLIKEDPELLEFVEKARDDRLVEKKQVEDIPSHFSNPSVPSHDSSADFQIRLVGKKSGRRYLAIINDESLWVRERSFTTLVQLAVAVKGGGFGWIKGPNFGTYDNYHQIVRRLREDIGEYGRMIENDKEASYRLAISPDSVSLDISNICSCMPESGLVPFFQEMGMLEDVGHDNTWRASD